jgi:hypothetical protein
VCVRAKESTAAIERPRQHRGQGRGWGRMKEKGTRVCVFYTALLVPQFPSPGPFPPRAGPPPKQTAGLSSLTHCPPSMSPSLLTMDGSASGEVCFFFVVFRCERRARGCRQREARAARHHPAHRASSLLGCFFADVSLRALREARRRVQRCCLERGVLPDCCLCACFRRRRRHPLDAFSHHPSPHPSPRPPRPSRPSCSRARPCRPATSGRT